VAVRAGWDLTPRQSVGLECASRGEPAVVAGCIALLRRQDVDDRLLFALGGPVASIVIHDGPRQRNQYWRRVWGARGLLYAWSPEAAGPVTAALSDEHWRVREMAAKVIARRAIGEALSGLTALREDPVPRVRAAAERATIALTAARS
jgi:HEAT repeat protein